MVLFSSYDECPALFASLAMALRHWKTDFGFIPPGEKQLEEEFRITSVPTLITVYFDPKAEEGKQILAPQYQGPLIFGAMKGWIEAFLITIKADKAGLFYFNAFFELFPIEYQDPFFSQQEKASVTKIQSDEDVNRVCNASVPLCVFVVLDENHEKFQSHQEWLEFIALRQSSQFTLFGFAWMHGADGDNFIHEFGVGFGDVPSFIVFSPKKNLYATLKRPTEPKEVDVFLQSVMKGEERTFSIQVTLFIHF